MYNILTLDFNMELDNLYERGKLDDLNFLCTWFRTIKILFSDKFIECRAEIYKIIPPMLDIVEVSNLITVSCDLIKY